MDREANYVAVGAFVLLVAAMAAGFVLWYSESGDRRSYVRHEIYFEGSVSGLSEGSSVRYLGVAVGRVLRIGLDPRDASRVRVVADISEDTPIRSPTPSRASRCRASRACCSWTSSPPIRRGRASMRCRACSTR
jgi:phospholipid/cholesterol/gamma-HCH transport system substrate-binding protein